MKESFAQQCLDILKHNDVKNEIKIIMNPLIEFLFTEIKPYIYFILFLVFLIFITILANLLLLIFFLRNKLTSTTPTVRSFTNW